MYDALRQGTIMHCSRMREQSLSIDFALHEGLSL